MLSGFCVTKALNVDWVEFFEFEDESADNAKNFFQKLSFFSKKNYKQHFWQRLVKKLDSKNHQLFYTTEEDETFALWSL